MGAKRLSLETRARTEFVPLAARIAGAAQGLLTGDGLLHVYVPHTTAGVRVIKGYYPDVVADVSRVLDRLAPWEAAGADVPFSLARGGR